MLGTTPIARELPACQRLALSGRQARVRWVYLLLGFNSLYSAVIDDNSGTAVYLINPSYS